LRVDPLSPESTGIDHQNLIGGRGLLKPGCPLKGHPDHPALSVDAVQGGVDMLPQMVNQRAPVFVPYFPAREIV